MLPNSRSLKQYDSFMKTGESTERDSISKLSPDSANQDKSLLYCRQKRLQTFEIVKLKLDPSVLAENGFYVVSKQQDNNIKKSSAFSPSSNYIIERTVDLVPAAILIKCAYCIYACALFKDSLLNTMFESPIEEHYEKSSKLCPIFAERGLKSECEHETCNCPSNETNNQAIRLRRNLKQPKRSIPVCSHSKQVNQVCENTERLESFDSRTNKIDNDEIELKDDNDTEMNNELEKLNLSNEFIKEKKLHLIYETNGARLDSFKEWPAKLSLQPADLARAGFYYLGIQDMIRCYICDGILLNLDYTPIEDHAKWFPECPRSLNPMCLLEPEKNHISVSSSNTEYYSLNDPSYDCCSISTTVNASNNARTLKTFQNIFISDSIVRAVETPLNHQTINELARLSQCQNSNSIKDFIICFNLLPFFFPHESSNIETIQKELTEKDLDCSICYKRESKSKCVIKRAPCKLMIFCVACAEMLLKPKCTIDAHINKCEIFCSKCQNVHVLNVF